MLFTIPSFDPLRSRTGSLIGVESAAKYKQTVLLGGFVMEEEKDDDAVAAAADDDDDDDDGDDADVSVILLPRSLAASGPSVAMSMPYLARKTFPFCNAALRRMPSSSSINSATLEFSRIDPAGS
jgi:hypothetical protein